MIAFAMLLCRLRDVDIKSDFAFVVSFPNIEVASDLARSSSVDVLIFCLT